MIDSILRKMGIEDNIHAVSQIPREEDGTLYNVWKVSMGGNDYILKEAKGLEAEIYAAYFSECTDYAPKCHHSTVYGGKIYILLEYISGENLMRCSRSQLILALDNLITMQKAHWNSENSAGYCYEKALSARKNRGNYLLEPVLEAAYARFLSKFAVVPRTLCHDDLLPFNLICDDSKVVFIDWEYGGILPYPVSLARLLAHSNENPDAFFYMLEEDKQFAVDYYYEKFICGQGISREEYDRTVTLFFFYEFCEWVYVGNKYGETDTLRYREYKEKALKLANRILNS